MNYKKLIAALAAAALLPGLLAGCGSKNMAQEADMAGGSGYYDQGVSYEFAAQAPAVMNDVRASEKSAADTTAIPLPENRKWVITMNLSVETENLDQALEQLNARIQETGGYVESQNITGRSSGSSRNRYAYLTVRVPAQKLDGFIENVSGVTNVVSSSRYVEDITLSYTDTEGRVKALKTEEARLLELMEQAQNMSDLLEIEARLTEVRYQLENYTSTLRLYDNQVDYATVELRVTEVEKYTPAEELGFWAKITQGLSQSIVDLGRAIVDFISWLIIDLPYLAVIALLAWLGVGLTRRSIRRRKAKKQARKEKTGEETPN